ncbi:unnamed protein product [Protopolystoma xenopodis]|uniref:Uncharacterized protein n=1 Tax=Protopolystoma xenopodis TaxID=117903 RepID=A0A448WKE0_9PLAT|nr:unnamed protein product [Protopolystoma xenopodis]
MDPELEEALREAEQRRQEKHRKMEEERENMRQGIRDKVYKHRSLHFALSHSSFIRVLERI